MKDLTFDDILAAADAEVRRVECPMLGGVLYVRPLTLDQLTACELARDDGRSFLGTMIALSLCDRNGKQLSATATQIDALGAKSFRALQPIAEVVKELNILDEDDIDEETEQLKKTAKRGLC